MRFTCPHQMIKSLLIFQLQDGTNLTETESERLKYWQEKYNCDGFRAGPEARFGVLQHILVNHVIFVTLVLLRSLAIWSTCCLFSAVVCTVG